MHESKFRLQDNPKNPKALSPTTSADSVEGKDIGTFDSIVRKNDCPDLRRDRDR